MYQGTVTETCRNLYRETAEFFESIRAELGEQAAKRGYAILYGPPPLEPPPILFIGFQPGGDRPGAGDDDPWPKMNQYAYGDGPLARHLRDVFGISLLNSCLGLNAIFLRAPSQNAYKVSVASDIRQRIEKFCLPRVQEFVRIINPGRIVVIGFSTLRLFGPVDPRQSPILRAENGGWLVAPGRIAGRDVFATPHLSGARLSDHERGRLTEFLRTLAAPPA